MYVFEYVFVFVKGETGDPLIWCCASDEEPVNNDISWYDHTFIWFTGFKQTGAPV